MTADAELNGQESGPVETESTADAPKESLVVIPEPLRLSDQMRRDNWQLYVLARSNDPAVMIPNTRKLVSNLVISAKIMKDFSRNGDIIFCIQTVNNAWYEYSENKDWGFAVQECETAVDRIGDLLYNEKWAIVQKDSFVAQKKKV